MQKPRNRFFGLGLKAFFIIVLMFLLLIALFFISGIVSERQDLQRSVIAEIAQSTSHEQHLFGPLLVLPYVRTQHEWKILDDGRRVPKEYQTTGYRYFFPQKLHYGAQFTTKQLQRGIYEARLYHNHGTLSGQFVLPENFGVGENFQEYQFDTAFLALGISDVRGIGNTLAASIESQGSTLAQPRFAPGSKLTGLGGGVHAPLANIDLEEIRNFQFSIQLDLQGTSRFWLAPLGRETEIVLAGDWPHPSFFGNFLPIERNVDAAGFKAQWKTNFFATNMQDHVQKHLDECRHDCSRSYTAQSFGVNFIEPVDQYRRTDRAIKYGLLFIGLTFAVFFLFEVLKRLPIHPMQYTLVGVALALFYVLLLSLSEHIGFLRAYIVSATACVLLLGAYVSGILGSMKRAATLVGLLIALYALLYGLLGAEEYALLLGSILVFALLAVVMLLTRKLDWYAFGRRDDGSHSG